MYRFLEAVAKDYMTRDVVTVSPETSLARLEDVLARHGFHAVPVVEGDRLVGLATTLDVLAAYRFTEAQQIPAYEDLARTPVAAIMTRAPVTAEPGTRLTRVLEALVERRTHSLPVVAGGRLVGIVSRGDVVRALRDAAAAAP